MSQAMTRDGARSVSENQEEDEVQIRQRMHDAPGGARDIEGGEALEPISRYESRPPEQKGAHLPAHLLQQNASLV
jgi:hypothetical protein